MEVVDAGYKMTEVGLIPEDWSVEMLGECSIKVGSGITPTGGEKVYVNEGRPFVRSQNVGWGILLKSDLAYITDEIHDTFSATEIRNGDVLLNITGASIGRSAIADLSIQGGNVNQHVCIIRTKAEILNSNFLNALLLSSIGQKQIDSFQAGGNREGLNFGQIRSFIIPLPPTLTEQKAISTALSDVDALISSLDRLIEKKMAIKQGAMQELLTPPDQGGKRLEGFSGEWVVSTLGEIAEISGAGVDKKINPNEKETRLLNYLDVYRRDYLYNHEINHTVTASSAKIISCNIREGDVFLTPSSETRNEIGIPAIAMEDMDGVVYSYHLYRVRYNTEIDQLFGMLLFKSSSFVRQSETYAEGSGTRYVVSMNKFRSAKVYLPPTVDEQKKISSILFDMDKEIRELQTKRDKYKLVKQGMMQELLTGKTRLI